MEVTADMFIPEMRSKGSAEIGRGLSANRLPAGLLGLYPHQVRVMRAAESNRTSLIMSHAGQGKTLAMIAAMAKYYGSHVVSTVHVITKKNIMGYTRGDVALFFERAGIEGGASFFDYKTYSIFTDRHGGLSDSELMERFGPAPAFVIDEAHSVYSYLKGTDKKESFFGLIVRLRNLYPLAPFTCITATPMLKSPNEIRLLARVLLLAGDLPERGVPLGAPGLRGEPPATQGALGAPEPGQEEPPEFAPTHIEINTACARAILDKCAVFYQPPPRAARQQFMGTRFRLGAPVPGGSGPHLDLEPGECARIAVPMGRRQAITYTNTPPSAFLRKQREISLCDPALEEALGKPGVAVGTVEEYSATLGLWLRVELEALAKGEWGIGCWYLDDIVTGGAELFRAALLAFGWADFGDAQAPVERPRLLYVTSETTLTASILEALKSPENVTGKLIRTVIYSEAANVGVSFPNCFRGGSEPGWSEPVQLQADSRRLRINSFDHFKTYLSGGPQAHPEFFAANRKYVVEGPAGYEIAPLTYDTLVYCPLVGGQEEIHVGGPALSIDYHVLTLRRERGDEITAVQGLLVEGSVDEQAGAPTDATDKLEQAGSYWALHALSDFWHNLGSYRPAPEGPPIVIPQWLPEDYARDMCARAHFYPPGYEVKGPAGGNNGLLWGLGSMGTCPNPLVMESAESPVTIEPGSANVLALLRQMPAVKSSKTGVPPAVVSEVNAKYKAIAEAIIGGFDALAEALAGPAARGGEDALAQALYALPAKIGSANTVILGMYARIWCYCKSGDGPIFCFDPPSSTEHAQSETFKGITWSSPQTYVYSFEADPGTGARRLTRHIEYFSPVHGDYLEKKWRDPLTLGYSLAAWSRPPPQTLSFVTCNDFPVRGEAGVRYKDAYTNDLYIWNGKAYDFIAKDNGATRNHPSAPLEFYILTCSGKLKVLTHNPSEPKTYARFEGHGPVSGGQGNTSNDIPLESIDIRYLYSYNENRPWETPDTTGVHLSDEILASGRLYRQVMVPEYEDGSRPHQSAIASGKFYDALSPDHPAHPDRFVRWALGKIYLRLTHPYSLQGKKSTTRAAPAKQRGA